MLPKLGGGGGGTSIYYAILCMCRARDPHLQPQISAPEHISFSQMRKKIRSGASSFYIFCRSGDHHSRNFKPFIAAHGRLTAASPNAFSVRQCSGVSGRPECQPDVSYSQFRRPHFHSQARSGASHFSLCRGTYLPKFGASHPPPPPLPPGSKDFLVCNLYRIRAFEHFIVHSTKIFCTF